MKFTQTMYLFLLVAILFSTYTLGPVEKGELNESGKKINPKE